MSDKDQRRFAALEAQRLGHGGIIYVAKLFGVSKAPSNEELLKSSSSQLTPLLVVFVAQAVAEKNESIPIVSSSLQTRAVLR